LLIKRLSPDLSGKDDGGIPAVARGAAIGNGTRFAAPRRRRRDTALAKGGCDIVVIQVKSDKSSHSRNGVSARGAMTEGKRDEDARHHRRYANGVTHINGFSLVLRRAGDQNILHQAT
jgi:hypothetical protein